MRSLRHFRVRRTLRAAGIGPDRWGRNRLLGLTCGEAALYRGILAAFVQGFAAPPGTAGELPAYAGASVYWALDTLQRRDLLRLDGTGVILRAQPFSAVATRHQVYLGDHPARYCTCAIDALGVAYMLEREALVTSVDPISGQEIKVCVRAGRRPVATPSTAVAVMGRPADSPHAVCALMNVFCSPSSARQHMASGDEHGIASSLLSIADAAAAGQLIFGGLLPCGATPLVPPQRHDTEMTRYALPSFAELRAAVDSISPGPSQLTNQRFAGQCCRVRADRCQRSVSVELACP